MALKDPEDKARYKRAWFLANKERELARIARWSAANPERVKKAKAKWREQNRERQKEASRAWAQKNHERRNESHRKWNAANKEHVLLRRRRYNVANRQRLNEQGRVYQQKRRALKRNNGGIFTVEDWRNLVKKSKRCYWCKRSFTIKLRPTHDHIIALSLGGENTIENSVCACSECNNRKSNRRFNPVNGQGILL